MIIRRAEQEDVKQVVKLSRSFVKKFVRYIEEDTPMNISEYFSYFIDTTYVLEIEDIIVGVCGGTVGQLHMTQGKAWHECLFYVNKKFRNLTSAFLSTVERYLRARGFKYIVMCSLPNDRIEKFYNLQGYKPLDRTFIKKLRG